MRARSRLTTAQLKSLHALGWRNLERDRARRPGPTPVDYVIPIDESVVRIGWAVSLDDAV